jgi:cell division protein FtsL
MGKTTLLAFVLAAFLSLLLFSVKQQVLDLEGELSGLNTSIIDDKKAIHVLKAEWSHLNNAQRLQELAERHLGLKPVKADQAGVISDLPKRSMLSEATNRVGAGKIDAWVVK